MNPEGKLHDWTDLPEEELPEMQVRGPNATGFSLALETTTLDRYYFLAVGSALAMSKEYKILTRISSIKFWQLFMTLGPLEQVPKCNQHSPSHTR